MILTDNTMKRLFAEFFFAAIILMAMVSCDKDYFEVKYPIGSEEAELQLMLEGDWKTYYEYSWGYERCYDIDENGQISNNVSSVFYETGEDNGLIFEADDNYFEFRFDQNGLFTILDAGDDQQYRFMYGLALPYYLDGNKLYDDGHLFAGDVTPYVTVRIVNDNTIELQVDDVGYFSDYICNKDHVSFEHKSTCELHSYCYYDWHQIITLKRINKNTVVTPPKGWMSYVPDNALLTQISIPGAHAPATYYGLYDDLTSVTQRVKMQALWDAGVRAFDFTVSNDEMLYYGKQQMERSFRDVISVLKEKLATETMQCTAIVFVRPAEGMDNAQKEEWREYIGDVVHDMDVHAAFWTPEMTMRQARGRIIVVMDEMFDWIGKKDEMPGALVVRQGNEATISSMAGSESEKMYIQDVKGVSHADKLNAVLEGMTMSMTFDNQEVKENTWMINSLSSYDDGYLAGALEIAPKVLSFIEGGTVECTSSDSPLGKSWTKTEEGPLGIVMMDFAVEETSKFSYISLTDAVRLNNWKYTMKTPSDL